MEAACCGCFNSSSQYKKKIPGDGRGSGIFMTPSTMKFAERREMNLNNTIITHIKQENGDTVKLRASIATIDYSKTFNNRGSIWKS